MRYKKPLSKTINWQQIIDDLYEMREACEDVRWIEGDDEALLELFDGDGDQAFEFKIAFSDLASECKQFSDDLDEIRTFDFMRGTSLSEDGAPIFDLFFPAIDKTDDLIGYDEYEGDYVGLGFFESEWAQHEARKKLVRLTKEQLLDLAGVAFLIARNYWGLLYRYDCLKAEIDIIRGENDGMLKAIKATEAAWERWNDDSDGGRYLYTKAEEDLDRILDEMPDRVWVE